MLTMDASKSSGKAKVKAKPAGTKFRKVKASSGTVLLTPGTASQIRASLGLKPVEHYKIHRLLARTTK